MILNLGCGNRIMDGDNVVNHDMVRHRPEINAVHDLDITPWPWGNNHFERIDARSVFEHLRLTLIEACNECWRILRPGGQLVIVYPSADGPTAHEDPTHRWFWTERSLDYLDPDTRHGQDYPYYTLMKWRILSCGLVNGRNVKAILTPRKP